MKKKTQPSALHALFRHNPLLKLLAINFCWGLVAAFTLLGALLYSDTFGLWTVMTSSSLPLLPLLLLIFGFVVTFASITMGAAIMMLPYDENSSGGKGKFSLTAFWHSLREEKSLIPAPIPLDNKSQTNRKPD